MILAAATLITTWIIRGNMAIPVVSVAAMCGASEAVVLAASGLAVSTSRRSL